jgi:DNA mismatch endonuclease, patch repair protein
VNAARPDPMYVPSSAGERRCWYASLAHGTRPSPMAKVLRMGGTERSWASSPATRASMRGNRSRDTKPELALRSAAHAAGLRYRVAARPLADLRRTADLVFRSARVAVFVDGCFWHGCPGHHTKASANADYWARKVEENRSRDRDTDARLTAAGWLPVRIWEHEDPAEVTQRLVALVRERAPRRVPPRAGRPGSG